MLEPSVVPDENSIASVRSPDAVDLLSRVLSVEPLSGKQDAGADEFPKKDFNVRQALRWLFGDFEGKIASLGFPSWKRFVISELNYALAGLDQLVSRQLNAVLHHPRFQQLESGWRGLNMLVQTAAAERTKSTSGILVRMLNVSWAELSKDFERAVEFDGSQMFRKIYEEEFGTAGGIPFSVMIGNYELVPRPSSNHRIDDLSVLEQVAGVAAAAFCPFMCAAGPAMFGADEFGDLQTTRDLSDGFGLTEFVKWRSIRQSEDARFIGLAMPRMLMRLPYSLGNTEGFSFQEDVTGPDASKYLWGNAAFGWGSVLIRAFAESGWLADIRGTERNRAGGGLVTNLPVAEFTTDRAGVGLRMSTDLIITDRQEAELAQLGFLPLCQCHDTPYCAFYSSQSIQQPRKFDDEYATGNARLSSMLHYILCVSRFAHYLKVLARSTVGSQTSPSDVQNRLNAWIKQYVTPVEDAKPEIKARRPLRSAEIEVAPVPGSPGTYQLIFRLQPHYQLDGLTAAIKLQTTTRSTGVV